MDPIDDTATPVPLHPDLPLSLLPVRGGRLVHGVVTDPAEGPPPDGPAEGTALGGARERLRTRVRLDAGVSALLRDEAVWVMSHDADEGLRMHEANAHAVPGDPALVDLADIRLLADEHRRAHLRTAAQAPVLLVEPGRRSRGTTTIDLSAGGCRVSLAYGQSLTPGQVLQVALDIDQGSTVWAAGEVVRVDEARHEAALRFTGLDPSDSERVERRLLRSLSRTGA